MSTGILGITTAEITVTPIANTNTKNELLKEVLIMVLISRMGTCALKQMQHAGAKL